VLKTEAVKRPTEVAQEVARLAREILGYELEIIWYGSWPGGRARPHSDIDLAVGAAAPIPLERMAALREVVDNVPTLYEIDLVDLASVGQSLRTEILLHGVRL
jgi:predicted nucleotidyltransferase